MILGDTAIREAIERGDVTIEPMAPWAIGSNSIDLHLSPHLAVYDTDMLDTTIEPRVRRFDIGRDGCRLMPGRLYLGSTVERTSFGLYLPIIEGTSSAGRLGLSIHATAGVGDVGFAGHWTLEITVVHPLVVYGGEPVAQVLLHEVKGVVTPYWQKEGANYAGAGSRPMPSRMARKRRWLGG